MTAEAMRAQFEAWYLTQGKYSFDPIGSRDCAMQWEGYQAAMHSSAVAELVEALRKYTAAGFGNSTDFYKSAEAYDAAVEALSNFTGDKP